MAWWGDENLCDALKFLILIHSPILLTQSGDNVIQIITLLFWSMIALTDTFVFISSPFLLHELDIQQNQLKW